MVDARLGSAGSANHTVLDPPNVQFWALGAAALDTLAGVTKPTSTA